MNRSLDYMRLLGDALEAENPVVSIPSSGTR
jgi:hypothetical protein